MSKFLRNILLFVIPFLLFLAGRSVYNYRKLMATMDGAIRKYGQKQMFLVGDSHIAALNNDKYDSNYVNIGQGGETIDASIEKILTLNEHRSNKIYFLSLAEHNLVYNARLTEERKRRLFKLKLYRERNKPAKTILLNFPDFVKYITFEGNQNSGFGDGTGTNNSKKFNSKAERSIEANIKRLHFQSDSLSSPSELAEKLAALSATLKENNSSLVLVRLPATGIYNKCVPEKVRQKYAEAIAPCRKKGIEIMDLDTFALNDSFFFDPIHLNTAGADTVYKAAFKTRRL